MAVGAALELQAAEDRLLLAPRAVAGLAAGLQVGPAQRVAGLLVEEPSPWRRRGSASSRRARGRSGRRRRSAPGADPCGSRCRPGTGAACTWRMSVGPDRRGARAEVAGRRRRLVGVALQAGHLGVLQLQLVGGLGVVEAGRLPSLGAVALLAVGAQLAAVLVEVAGGAGGRQAELAVPPLGDGLLHLRLGDVARVVALGAVEPCGASPPAGSRSGRGRSPSCRPGPSPPAWRRAPACSWWQVWQARSAGLSRPWSPLPADEPPLQLLVAGQAVVRAELLAGGVALGAVGEPLQRRVRPGELAGREDVGARRRVAASAARRARAARERGADGHCSPYPR